MSTALVILAKAPIAGLAKTRLIGALGANGAAQLAWKMLGHTLAQAKALKAPYCELCVTPSLDHEAFQEAYYLAQGQLSLSLQGPGDLGERMQRVFGRLLPLHRKVLLIGTDAPSLDVTILRQAQLALDLAEAVFVPAMDGGYALVGLTRIAPRLFQDMTWSTSEVMAHTRLRARQEQLIWKELMPVHDIDEPADLVHLPKGW